MTTTAATATILHERAGGQRLKVHLIPRLVDGSLEPIA